MKWPWLLAIFALTACGDDLSNAVFEQDGRFLAAVPRAQDLRMTGPSEDAADGTAEQALAAEPSELYLFTRTTTLGIDRGVINRLRDIERLIEQEPTERSADRRVWGPFRHPLDPLTSRFVMDRAADGTFVFAFEQWASGGDPVPVIRGTFDPENRAGTLVFDLDTQARLGTPGHGTVSLDFSRAEGGLSLTLVLTRFSADGTAAPLDQTYTYERDAVGAGEFEFAFTTDQGRFVQLHSRWQADGAGRADARITGDRVTIELSECWDATFARVYYGQLGAPRLTRGREARCAFPDREPPI